MTRHNTFRPCRHGMMVFNRFDQFVGRSLGLYGEFSEGEHDLFRQILRPGDTVLEGGANIGAHTVGLANLVGPMGQVVAIEPQMPVFQLLCANIALNSLGWALPINVALGEKPGSTDLPHINPDQIQNWGGVPVGDYPEQDSYPVEVVPLDTVGGSLRAIRLIKLDVEGSEFAALHGARALIERDHPILYVENDRPEKSAELVNLLEMLDYALWWHEPPLFNPANWDGLAENVFPGIVSRNMLCLPIPHSPDLRAATKGLRRVT